MLVIRDCQMESFCVLPQERFEQKALDHLKATYPTVDGVAWLDETWRRFIQRGARKAGRYGLCRQRDIIRFIELMIEIDPDFDHLENMQWARAILDEPGLSGQAKISLISQQVEAG